MSVLEIEKFEKQPFDQANTGLTLVDYYLLEQQSLTAVERFARDHESAIHATGPAGRYAALLPAAPPAPGQQYAFDVDLDACSGCKSCVTACHALNGLDDDETFRQVGLLHGGSASQAFLQHVTAACHHCLDPACLNGCPVRAYEKDGTTGIVRHLDDQCIGCQYCIFACPYDVPRYNRARGIVRKCDMCSHRLAAGEAPACVQACPNSAIRITVVSRADAAANCETGNFLPGSPDPHLTQPTTNYRSRRVFPRNTLPADYYSVHREHAHWPLIVMLVLTQLSVGAFVVELLHDGIAPVTASDSLRGARAIFALGFGLLALAANTLHLGRPLYAFRAVLGLRTSWLSREILAFGAFAGCAAAYAVAVAWQTGPAAAVQTAPTDLPGVVAFLQWAVVATGLAGVFCSIMIYACTQREFWAPTATTVRFLLSSLVLGSAASLGATAIGAAAAQGVTVADALAAQGALPLRLLMTATPLKLLFEGSLFLRLRDRQHTQLKRSALLMAGDLSRHTLWRFALGISGGLIAPAIVASRGVAGGNVDAATAFFIVVLFAASLAGELLERYLYFSAVATPRMPGGLN